MEFVTQQLRSLGIEIPASSRLDRMRRVFRNPDGSSREVPANSPDHNVGLESLRDYMHLEFILEQLPHRFTDDRRASLTAKLRTAVRKDGVDPAASVKHTKGRDTLVELYVAAVLAQGGASAIGLGVTDVTILLDGEAFSIEAKRPKKPRTLVPAIEDAIKQLKQRATAGAVFVDVSRAWDQNNVRILRPMSDAEFREVFPQVMKKFISTIHADVQKLMVGSPACAVCFQIFQMRQVLGTGWNLEGCMMYVDGENLDARRLNRLQSFKRVLLGASAQ